MANFSSSSSGIVNQGWQQYPYPSHANAASFVSIKLSGTPNYIPWQEQMLSLVCSHDMYGFLNGTLRNPLENKPNINTKAVVDAFETKCWEWKRSDTLLKGWIFGSLSEDVMRSVVGLQTANEVWNKLQADFTTPPASVQTNVPTKIGYYIPLCRAIEMAEWDKAQEFFNNDKDALTGKLNTGGNRALHVAIGNPKNGWIFERLLDQIDPVSLPTLLNDMHQNPLHYAAVFGNTEAAEKLVQKNPKLLFFVDNMNNLPILINVAHDLLKMYPELVMLAKGSPLLSMASMTHAYPSAKRYTLYQRFVYSHLPMDVTYKIQDIENQETYGANLVTSNYAYLAAKRIYANFWKVALRYVPHIKQLHEDKVKHNMALKLLEFICEELARQEYDVFDHYAGGFIMAVKSNILEMVEQIIQTFPDSIWTMHGDGYAFSQLSILYRCELVYNFFLHNVTRDKHLHNVILDKGQNNLLHLAGRLAPKDKLNMVNGAALQMQRELQWFKEVSKFVPPRYREAKNIERETPIMVFRKEHEGLRQKGEEWIKKTADSCTITTALIITIAFAAAITVPGGTNGDTGRSIFETKPSFIIFVVSNAISLFTSTTSLLLFLSILTARYAEEDFLYKLPKRLILGLLMLFISMTSMMIAFSATLYVMTGHGKSWILIPIAALTCLPIASFVTLQLPLLGDLISSTYGQGIFHKVNDLKKKL